jgi:hypothetical protein
MTNESLQLTSEFAGLLSGFESVLSERIRIFFFLILLWKFVAKGISSQYTCEKKTVLLEKTGKWVFIFTDRLPLLRNQR